MLRIEVHQTRWSCFSESEGPLGAVLQITSVFSCFFTEERIEFGHTDIKPRSLECCSDVCPSVGFSHLHICSWSSTRVTIRFLFTSLDMPLLYQLLCLRIMEATVLPKREPSGQQEVFFCSLPQICASIQNCIWPLQAVSLTSLLSFSSDMHCQQWGLRCVPFQIMSNQFNLPQVDPDKGV